MAFAPPIHLVCVGEEKIVISWDLGVAGSSEDEDFCQQAKIAGGCQRGASFLTFSAEHSQLMKFCQNKHSYLIAVYHQEWLWL